MAADCFFRTLGKTETTVISITRPVYSTKTFGVCIDSPLFGHVKAQTIVENIEINKVLGAEWFTFYIYNSDHATLQVFYSIKLALMICLTLIVMWLINLKHASHAA